MDSLGPGTLVIVHLREPTEKFWGVLERLDTLGAVLRGLNVSSFDDWLGQAARSQSPAIDLATMFVPMFRVERIFLDEQVGEVESYGQRFENRVGVTVEEFLGLPGATSDSGELPS